MIIGDRLRFRAVEPEDLPIFLRWINDPEVRYGLGLYLPLSMADEQEWYDGVRKQSPDERNLVIEARSPAPQGGPPAQPGVPPAGPGVPPAGPPTEPAWRMIGGTGFFNLDRRNRSAELGIMIGDKSCWNRGFGTEAVRLLARHGFNTLNLNRIYLRVLENNPRAIRAYEKAGFTHEGRQRQAEYKDGKYLDLLVMSILKDEFKPF
jgi:RimJ/RimL family protein N-acetyltransferase